MDWCLSWAILAVWISVAGCVGGVELTGDHDEGEGRSPDQVARGEFFADQHERGRPTDTTRDVNHGTDAVPAGDADAVDPDAGGDARAADVDATPVDGCIDLEYTELPACICSAACMHPESGACMSTEEEAVSVYRSQGCYEETLGSWWFAEFLPPVDFETSEVATYFEWLSWDCFSGPIVDSVHDCGTHIEVGFHVNEPCNRCDAEGQLCLSLVLPSDVRPVRFRVDWREPILEPAGDAFICRMRSD